jgi:allantoinase
VTVNRDAYVTVDLVVRSRATQLPGGQAPAAVTIHRGRIVSIEPYEADLSAVEDVDLGELALLPGLVDSHVHVNEPGRTEWEGFATATRAAAAGGITTLIDMPLNSIPPVVDVEALRVKRAAAAGQVHVDVGFWGGAIPGNIGQLAALNQAGVFGFKCFTSPSGVDEFPPLPWPELPAVLAELARLDALLLVHAEDPDELDAAPPATADYPGFLASRPPAAEDSAIRRIAGLAAATGTRTHVLHLSSASALPIVARAKAAGVRLSAETCPHYLTLAAEDIPAGATEFKCCPPIRDRANAGALWRALADGTLDCVVSDHSPSPPQLKSGGFDTAWGGITSLQLGLPVVWTHARSRGHSLADVVGWMSTAPAHLVGLHGRKGAIAPGHDADLVAFAPDDPVTVDPATLAHRHPTTPYAGAHLTGTVHQTWLRGHPVDPATPKGKLLNRLGGN